MKPGEQTDMVRRVRELLQAEPGRRLALAYGSLAAGKMRSDSDVDIAVLFDRPLDVDKRMALLQRLELSLSRTADRADLFSLNGTILRLNSVR